MYPIIAISDDASETPEQVGSKYKFWFANQRRMFKLGRDGTGEHWSEKIACELCTLLGLPHASYEFARWKGHLGTVSDNFVPPSGRLILGNELLSRFAPGYDGARRFLQRQHTLRRVIAAVLLYARFRPVGVPNDFPLSNPRDFFVGYILLDAWIGNTDRHHENWGLVLVSPGFMHLSPTFDHASSLGRELSDDARMKRLTTRDPQHALAAYVARARSGFYRTEADGHPMSTLEAFREAAKLCPKGAAYWLERLRNVTPDQIDGVLGQVPRDILTDPSKEFARSMLLQNQTRICSDE